VFSSWQWRLRWLGVRKRLKRCAPLMLARLRTIVGAVANLARNKRGFRLC